MSFDPLASPGKRLIVVKGTSTPGQKAVIQSPEDDPGSLCGVSGESSSGVNVGGSLASQVYNIAGMSGNNTIIILPAGSTSQAQGEHTVVNTASTVAPALAAPRPAAVRVPRATNSTIGSMLAPGPQPARLLTNRAPSRVTVGPEYTVIPPDVQARTQNTSGVPVVRRIVPVKSKSKRTSGISSFTDTSLDSMVEGNEDLQITVDPSRQTADQQTLTLPQIDIKSMKTRKICIEVEVDTVLNVSSLEHIRLANGKTKYFFKISQVSIKTESTTLDPVQRGRRQAQKLDGTCDTRLETAPKRRKTDVEDLASTALKVNNPEENRHLEQSSVEENFENEEEVENIEETVSDDFTMTEGEVDPNECENDDKETGGEGMEEGIEDIESDAGQGVQEDNVNSDVDKPDEMETGEEADKSGTVVDDNDDVIDESDEVIVKGENIENMPVLDGSKEWVPGDDDDSDDHGDEDDDFLEEVESMEQAGKKKRGRKKGSKKKPKEEGDKQILGRPKRKRKPKVPKDELGEGDGAGVDESPKRIYVKTNAYAQNDNYQMIHEDGVKMFECKLCGWKTKYIVSMKDHVRAHLNEKPFICGVCTRAFCNQSNLNSHLARHYDSRPFECDMCDQSFKLKSSLNAHKKRHLGERKYECEICGNKLYTSSSLKTHMLTHSDERPHKCKVCFKAFKSAPILQRHEFIHTGQGKYECYICDEKFVRKEYWRQHMKKKHNEKVNDEKRKSLYRKDLLETKNKKDQDEFVDSNVLTVKQEHELEDIEQIEQKEEETGFHPGEDDQRTSENKPETYVIAQRDGDNVQYIVSQGEGGEMLVTQAEDGQFLFTQGEVDGENSANVISNLGTTSKTMLTQEGQLVTADGQIVEHPTPGRIFKVCENGQVVMATEGEGPDEQVPSGAGLVTVIGQEEGAELGDGEEGVRGLDKDTQAQVEYLVSLQYEYVKMDDMGDAQK